MHRGRTGAEKFSVYDEVQGHEGRTLAERTLVTVFDLAGFLQIGSGFRPGIFGRRDLRPIFLDLLVAATDN
jgi:hypothetical protein